MNNFTFTKEESTYTARLSLAKEWAYLESEKHAETVFTPEIPGKCHMQIHQSDEEIEESQFLSPSKSNRKRTSPWGL